MRSIIIRGWYIQSYILPAGIYLIPTVFVRKKIWPLITVAFLNWSLRVGKLW